MERGTCLELHLPTLVYTCLHLSWSALVLSLSWAILVLSCTCLQRQLKIKWRCQLSSNHNVNWRSNHNVKSQRQLKITTSTEDHTTTSNYNVNWRSNHKHTGAKEQFGQIIRPIQPIQPTQAVKNHFPYYLRIGPHFGNGFRKTHPLLEGNHGIYPETGSWWKLPHQNKRW